MPHYLYNLCHLIHHHHLAFLVKAGHIKFAAFSYLTAVLIVSGTSLGDTLRGCWHAFCATAQVVPLAVLWRWIIDPVVVMPVAAAIAAVAMAAAAFVVALLECTHLTAKKIAFGQIVLVCSKAVLSDGLQDKSVVISNKANYIHDSSRVI